MQRLNRQSLLQHLHCLVELLHLPVAHTLEVIRIHIARIELHRLLKTLQRIVQFVVRMLRQPQVVPCLRHSSDPIARAACSTFLASSIFCSVSSAMPSLMAACASFGSFLNDSAKLCSAFSVNCCPINATPRLFSRTASVEARLRPGHDHRPRQDHRQSPARLHPLSAQNPSPLRSSLIRVNAAQLHEHPVYASAASIRSPLRRTSISPTCERDFSRSTKKPLLLTDAVSTIASLYLPM